MRLRPRLGNVLSWLQGPFGPCGYLCRDMLRLACKYFERGQLHGTSVIAWKREGELSEPISLLGHTHVDLYNALAPDELGY